MSSEARYIMFAKQIHHVGEDDTREIADAEGVFPIRN